MQFGNALLRVLQRLAYCNPTFGPPLLTKIDMADSYYHVLLSADAGLQLAVCLPSDGLSSPLIGIPLSLPMGWNLSPPFFCAFTEMCADLTNTVQVPMPAHPYHNAMQPHLQVEHHASYHPEAVFPYNPSPPTQPLQYADVYMDDFLLTAQHPRPPILMDTLLHHLHSVFRDPKDSPR
jgi:hypothetical protein